MENPPLLTTNRCILVFQKLETAFQLCKEPRASFLPFADGIRKIQCRMVSPSWNWGCPSPQSFTGHPVADPRCGSILSPGPRLVLASTLRCLLPECLSHLPCRHGSSLPGARPGQPTPLCPAPGSLLTVVVPLFHSSLRLQPPSKEGCKLGHEDNVVEIPVSGLNCRGR